MFCAASALLPARPLGFLEDLEDRGAEGQGLAARNNWFQSPPLRECGLEEEGCGEEASGAAQGCRLAPQGPGLSPHLLPLPGRRPPSAWALDQLLLVFLSACLAAAAPSSFTPGPLTTAVHAALFCFKHIDCDCVVKKLWGLGVGESYLRSGLSLTKGGSLCCSSPTTLFYESRAFLLLTRQQPKGWVRFRRWQGRCRPADTNIRRPHVVQREVDTWSLSQVPGTQPLKPSESLER